MPPEASHAPGGAAGLERGRVLLALAREAIAAALHVPPPAARWPAAELEAPWLRAPGACFVTLTRQGRLRGCIGSVRARRPLADDLRANARAAALSDPRFPQLTAGELPDTRIEVSLLSAASPLPAASEEEALAALRPGLDGIILEIGGETHATFLPQVWENLPSPRDFLAHLKHKAGLSPGFWSPDLRLHRYTVTKWVEAEPPERPPT
ncbi:MAG TPA: AmmeMemoRadiSam system protein A [Thermoanaerobaculia bacterium]|nr:AmmeMemoRadiSam system protein A [Thermoanaerobaculia bacterium]